MKFLLSTLCAVGLASLGLDAQTPTTPDFSGTWTMDLTRSEAAAQGTPIGPVTVAIRQAPDEIRVETTQNGTTQAVRYFPDSMKRLSADEPAGTFRWEGSQLVTNLAAYINKQAVTSMEVRRLNPAGTEMTVTVTLVVQHGYDSGASSAPGARNFPNTSMGTNVFVKAR
jgi:hypothetical protein